MPHSTADRRARRRFRLLDLLLVLATGYMLLDVATGCIGKSQAQMLGPESSPRLLALDLLHAWRDGQAIGRSSLLEFQKDAQGRITGYRISRHTLDQPALVLVERQFEPRWEVTSSQPQASFSGLAALGDTCQITLRQGRDAWQLAIDPPARSIRLEPLVD